MAPAGARTRGKGRERHRVEGAGEFGGEGTHDVPGCYSARMKRVLVILLAVALLAGCASKTTANVSASPKTAGSTVSPIAISSSHAAPRHDPFVGTWHVAGYGPGSGIAISKVSGAYRVTLVTHFKPEPGYSWLCARRGSNELTVGPGQTEYVEVIKFNPTSRRLTWTSNGMDPEVFTKVSDSTAPPTPWPTTSP